MKNFIIIIVIIAALTWLKPHFASAPPADSISQCLHPAIEFPANEDSKKQLNWGENNYKMCKYALILNDKKYTDRNWKNYSNAELNSLGFYNPPLVSNVIETIVILNTLKNDSFIIAGIQNDILNDKKEAIKVLEEAKSIISMYKFYDEKSHAVAYINEAIQSISSAK